MKFTTPEDWELNFGTQVVPVLSGGSTDYNELSNKPSVNGVELIGNKTNEELDICPITNSEIEDFFKRLE